MSMSRRRWTRAACIVLASVLVGVCAAVIAGCGTAPRTSPISSPEHLGRWLALETYGENVKIDVAGTPGHYTAQYISYVPTLTSGTLIIPFSGGKADEQGNVTFDSWGSFHLTLGPVSGNRMTATWTVNSRSSTLNMVRQ